MQVEQIISKSHQAPIVTFIVTYYNLPVQFPY
jgi:hypothetical protein